jgi:hypothetical protein
VRGDLSQFNRDLKTGATQGTRTLGGMLKGVFSPRNLAIAGVAGGIALAGAITAGLADAVRALIDIERLNAQTDAVIKSTGSAANVTRQQIEDAAEAAESATTIQRESVQEAQNMLLTFTNVRNEVGEGNDIFTQATDAVLDMSVALGTDAKGAAIQLGKALNDPIKGVTALTRVGVTFTDQQRDQIAAMVASNDLLGAQGIILAELNKEFGGSAEAFAGTTAGKVQRFQNDIGNMFESVVVGIVDMADEATAAGEAVGGWVVDQKLNFGAYGELIHRVADDTGSTFQEVKDQVLRNMREMGVGFEEAMDMVQGTAATTAERLDGEFRMIAQSPTARLNEAIPDITASARAALSDPIIEALLGGKAEAERIASETPGGIAQALLDAQFSVEDAAASIAQAMEDALHPMIEMAQITGFLSSSELAQGLQSNIPAVRARAMELKEAAEGRFRELQAASYSYGFNTGTSYAAGMKAAYGWVRDEAGNLAAAARNQIGIQSEPKDHSSPLYGITKWGGNIAKTLAEGINSELGLGRSAARNLAASLVPGFAGSGAVPRMAGAAGSVAGVGNTYHVHLEDKLQARTVTDIGHALRRLGEAGLLPGSLTPK